MFNTLKTLTKLPKNPLKNSNTSKVLSPKLYFYLSAQSFSNHPRREPKKKLTKKKTNFYEKAKSALFDGFFQGSDFYKLEKFVYLREAKTYEEKAQKNLQEGNPQQAIEEWKIAFQLFKKSCEENDPELAYYSSQIGDIYLKAGQVTQALDYYEQSLQQLLNSFILKHEPIFRCYHQLAKCLIRTNEYGEAIYCLRECLKRAELVESKEEAKEIGVSCEKMLAEIYLKYEKYDKALECIEKIGEEKGEFLLDYGLCVGVVKGEYEKAEEIVKGFVEKEVERYGERSFMVAVGKIYMGRLEILKGENEKGRERIEEAEGILKELMGGENKFVGKCEMMKGEMLLREGEWKRSVENGMKGLEIYEEGDFELGRCYGNIGEGYMRGGRWDLAKENLQRGLEEREKLLEGFEEGDMEYLMLNMTLAGVCKKKGDVEGAGVYYVKFLEELWKVIAERTVKEIEERDFGKSE